MSERYTATIHENGRIVIPKALRKKLGVDGLRTELTFELDGDEVTISSRLAGIRRAQKMMRELDPEGKVSSESFLRWRRENAALENAELDNNGD